MPIRIFDDFTGDNSPDVAMGNVSSGVTFSNPNLDATDWIALREIRLNDDGSALGGGLVSVFHLVLGVDNPENSAQELSGGTFRTALSGVGSGFPSNDNDLSGTVKEESRTYAAWVAAFVAAAKTAGDTVIDNTEMRDGITVYTNENGADIREINLPANTKRYYLVNTVAGSSHITAAATSFTTTLITGQND